MLINILKDNVHMKKIKNWKYLPTVCLPMIGIELCNYIDLNCI